MKFELIEPVNQIKSNLFVKHTVEELPGGCLIQKCVSCGEVIEDYTPNPNIIYFGGSKDLKNGLPAGDVYVNKSSNTGIKITQKAIEFGICSIPKDVIDCTTVNS